jgi:hypothetical protein
MSVVMSNAIKVLLIAGLSVALAAALAERRQVTEKCARHGYIAERHGRGPFACVDLLTGVLYNLENLP